MKVYLASAGVRPDHSHIRQFERLADCDRVGRHHLTDDPSDADIALFVECHQLPDDWQLQAIRSSPVNQRYPSKVFVYDERDRPWCAFPGLYVSMPTRAFRADWQKSAPYFLVDDPVERLPRPMTPPTPELLFSFVGSRTHPCRNAVLALAHPRGQVRSVDGFLFHDDSSADFHTRRTEFAEAMFRSKFVLCPRGHGTSSIRLFETLAAGRAPVIISDDWCPPSGPDWDQIAVVWPERRIDELPRHLELIESEAEHRGTLARAAYEEWYAVDVMFDRLMSQLEQLRAARPHRPFPPSGVRDGRYVRLAAGVAANRARGELRRVRGRAASWGR